MSLRAEASATCRVCNGCGWVASETVECACIGERQLERVARRAMSEPARAELERRLRRVLVAGRITSALYDASSLAGHAAAGNRPPSAEALARWLGVSLATAAAVMGVLDEV